MNKIKKLIPQPIKDFIKRFITINATQSSSSDPIKNVTVISFPYIKHFDVHGLSFDFYIVNPTGKEWYDHDEANDLAEPKMLMGLFAAGDKVLEIGSHQGFYSTLIAKIVGPNGKVLALDAFPQNSFTVNANFGINGLGHAQALTIAGAEKSGEVEFSLDENGSVLLEGETWHKGPVIKVPAMSIDDLDKKYGPFNAIKIDVEGLEQQVLQGGKEFLKRKPKIAIEIHRDSMMEVHGGDIQKMLELMRADQYTGQVFYKSHMNDVYEFDRNNIEESGDFNLALKAK